MLNDFSSLISEKKKPTENSYSNITINLTNRKY